MKILIIEDNLQLAADIEEYLQEQRFVTSHAKTFQEASEKTELYKYDLIVLDLGLPDGDGMDLLQEIKKHQAETGIVILTAKHALEYKLKGLEQGADDYLTKPFHLAELNARIRTILRRKFEYTDNTLKISELEINLNAAEVSINQKNLNLTHKEYDLLLFFTNNKNKLLTKETIAEHLWGDHADQADNFNFVYNHIKNLRRKIIKAGAPDYIKSMYGMGYKFITEA